MDVATHSRNKYLYEIKLLPGFRVHEAAIGLATERLLILSLGGNDTIRNHLVANSVYCLCPDDLLRLIVLYRVAGKAHSVFDSRCIMRIFCCNACLKIFHKKNRQ